MTRRSVAVLLHPERAEALTAGAQFVATMANAGIEVYTFPDDVARIGREAGVTPQPIANEPVDVAVVFGGDGTILRAAEWAHRLSVPLLGVNLGHVGFLAELETSDFEVLSQAVIAGEYRVEERLALSVQLIETDGTKVWESFAVNEVSLEKQAREKMLTVLVSVDGKPLSRWGCDGVLVATPTGSTAYAFSAGGPVVWPEVKAMLLVPLSAHALFNRSMVLSKDSSVRIDLVNQDVPGVIWCDGRRSFDMQPGQSINVVASPRPLRLARLAEQPFTTRLVRKFDLPVHGWRSRNHNP